MTILVVTALLVIALVGSNLLLVAALMWAARSHRPRESDSLEEAFRHFSEVHPSSRSREYDF